MDGRQGTRTKSEALAVSRAVLSAWGAVSIITSSPPACCICRSSWRRRLAWADRTTGSSAARRSAHLAADAWGSRSSTAVLRPAVLDATARCRARVVLPEPPFWLMTDTTFMSNIFQDVDLEGSKS